jgi:hypothetical protein
VEEQKEYIVLVCGSSDDVPSYGYHVVIELRRDVIGDTPIKIIKLL